MKTVNKAGIDLIKEFEGLRLEAYKCSAGVWTIGYGTTAGAGVGIKPEAGMVITEAEAEWYLEQGVAKFASGVDAVITVPVNENERGALVSLAYNIGQGAFKRSSCLKWLNAGDKAKAAAAIKLWNKAGGKVLAGLVRRREAEVDLFMTPVVKEAPKVRESAKQSRTVQATVVQVASAGGGALAALQALDGTAQIIVLIGCFGVAALALFILRERLKAWASGWR